MAYTVKRWDSWSVCEGLSGLEGLEAMLNEQHSAGLRLSQLVVHSEDIYLVVFEDGETTPAR